MRLFVATLAIASLVVGTAAAHCHVPGASYVRVGDGDVSATGPSFLVGLDRDDAHEDGEAAPSALRIAGSPPVVLAVEAIAPGLLRARSSRPVAPGAHQVQGFRIPLTVHAAAIATAPALAAPDVVSISHGSEHSRHVNTLMAQLRTAPPTATVAVVLAREGHPIAWMPRAASETTSVLVARTSCAREADGYSVPAAGVSVTLQFVDAAGNVSPPSRAVVVQ